MVSMHDHIDHCAAVFAGKAAVKFTPNQIALLHKKVPLDETKVTAGFQLSLKKCSTCLNKAVEGSNFGNGRTAEELKKDTCATDTACKAILKTRLWGSDNALIVAGVLSATTGIRRTSETFSSFL